MAVQNCKYSAATALDETMIITTNVSYSED